MAVRVVVATPVRKFEVEVPDLGTTTVIQLKRLLHALEGVPPALQLLSCRGSTGETEVELAEGARSLRSFGVADGGTIRLTPNISGQRPKRCAQSLPTPVPTVAASPTPHEPFIAVYVRRFGGRGPEVEIRLRPNSTVAELAASLQGVWGVPPDQQRLTYRDTPLGDDPDRTLAFYNITDGTSLAMW